VTRPGDDAGSSPVDDFASSVLDVVDSIPPGRVMSYGDIAEYLSVGPGPRQVGRVMATYGGAVAWWRTAWPSSTTWPKAPRSAPPAPQSASTCAAPAGPATPPATPAGLLNRHTRRLRGAF
jgi:hypothetical protein